MKKVVVILLTILMLFSLLQGVLGENVVKADETYQWVPINNGLYGGKVESLAIDPANTQIIYAGTGNGVFKSTDGGANWSQINNGLPEYTDVRSLAIDPANTQLIYAGTEGGVFKYISSTYTITASAGSGGIIDPSGAVTVAYDAYQTFTVTPDIGYHIKDILVDSSSVGAMPSYTFEHVTANHTIEAQFEINVTSFTLHIPSGWSLISVPFNTNASLLACPLIYYFDGSAWLPETATLHPGRGYLVLSTTPTSRDVILTGTPLSSPFSLSSPGSWQLIGNPFASPCTLSSTSPILLIYFFDSTSSTWLPADTNNLQPGLGYLVLTSSPGTFTFTLKP